VRFVLCGTGPDSEKYSRQAQARPNVLMPGWVNAAQIWTLARMSMAGLAPYVSSDNFVRNLPNKPIEYLSAGLPIVSSLQGVLARLLAEQHCGFTYRNGDVEQLAGAIARLRDDSQLWAQMSANALRIYRERFVAENVYREMQDYLAEISAVHDRHAVQAA
jgi:glycosyltransferase involved in cell wall biosynthesis